MTQRLMRAALANDVTELRKAIQHAERAGLTNEATMARAKAPKRRPKTASFDPAKLGAEFAKLEAIEPARAAAKSEPAPRPKSTSSASTASEPIMDC